MGRMWVVKDIDVVECDSNIAKITSMKSPNDYTFPKMDNGKIYVDPYLSFDVETIHGHEYRYNDNRVVIGWASKVYDTLGIPINALEEQQKMNESLRAQNNYLRETIDGVNNNIEKLQKSWWKRLWFFITGDFNGSVE